MDSKLRLLKEFYSGLPKDRAKVETGDRGFAFLESMISDGVAFDYGEMHGPSLLHKYRLSNINPRRMDELLLSHLAKTNNVCLYFDDVESSVFCYNLDNNHKGDNTAVLPEMKLAVSLLRELLTVLGCEPLVIASGRGYHVWCRLAVAIENKRLHNFMLRSMAKTLAWIHERGHENENIKANFYPDPRIRNTVSLRLFGSAHARNKTFSRILAKEGLLDEAASWEAFEHHLRHKTISGEQFQEAYGAIMADF